MSFFKKMVDKFEDLVTDDDDKKAKKDKEAKDDDPDKKAKADKDEGISFRYHPAI